MHIVPCTWFRTCRELNTFIMLENMCVKSNTVAPAKRVLGLSDCTKMFELELNGFECRVLFDQHTPRTNLCFVWKSIAVIRPNRIESMRYSIAFSILFNRLTQNRKKRYPKYTFNYNFHAFHRTYINMIAFNSHARRPLYNMKRTMCRFVSQSEQKRWTLMEEMLKGKIFQSVFNEG